MSALTPPTALDLLVAWRDRMADPSKVVLTRENLYEDEAGNDVDQPHACRGCMLGNQFLAADALGAGEAVRFETDQTVRDALPAEYERGIAEYFETVGRESSVQVLDRVIAERGAR